MKIGRIGFVVLTFFVMGGLAEATPPKAVSLLKRTTTSQSRGSYGFRTTKYNKPGWGRREHQSLGRVTPVVSPYVRGR
jgi:hypothetical protein